MRKICLSLAAAASALAVASPATAQVFPPPQGYAYGYNNYGHVRALQGRIDAIQRQIAHFDRRNVVTEREARRLREDSRQIERRLRVAARNGLHPNEGHEIERRIVRLEQRVMRDARDGHRWGYNNGRFVDRDRDGRNDRYEDDRGRDRD